MAFERYIRSGARMLRCGYTTGSCAALAAAGAARLLLTGEMPEKLRLVTPKGWPLEVTPADWSLCGETARCAVKKDAGDDPDVTDGCLVYASVRKTARGLAIDGGEGVGRVTRAGLDQPVGAAAINSVPRQMIAAAVEDVCAAAGYGGGLSVVISVPEGEALARRTFNPMLGIEGGISILGSSGVVEPMSERALLDTIELQLRQAARSSRRVLLTPGSYGADYLLRQRLDALGVPVVKCSNFIGDALDAAAAAGFRQALLVGHIGKLVKLAGGVMNTHSRQADCRAELFTAHAALCGADTALCSALMESVTADACLALLDAAGLRQRVTESLLSAIERRLTRRAGGDMRVGALVFSNQYGTLGATAEARRLLEEWT